MSEAADVGEPVRDGTNVFELIEQQRRRIPLPADEAIP